MARSNSTQHKLDRVRPPRVHVTYDVEVGDAIEMKNCPLSWAFSATSRVSRSSRSRVCVNANSSRLIPTTSTRCSKA